MKCPMLPRPTLTPGPAKKLQEYYSLGAGKYLENVEDALQVLQLQNNRSKHKKKNGTANEDGPELGFMQQKGPKCYCCGKFGHISKDCPKKAGKSKEESKESDQESSNAQAQQGWTGVQVDTSELTWCG